jgi:protein gp37
MSIKTKIQWCDSTANPTMGCDGCELWGPHRKTCYAGLLHTRFGGVTPGYAPSFAEVTLFLGRMEEAARWSDLSGKKRKDKPWLDRFPRLVFISDMSDALSSVVPFEFLRDEIIQSAQSDLGRRHRWLWLSKRPERMAEFSRWLKKQGVSWPANLWAGTSVTNQATTKRVKHLLAVGARRFVSVEPQTEDIEVGDWMEGLNWLIHGGESGHRARPFEIGWAKQFARECRRRHIPYFLKQLGSHVCRDGKRVTYEDNHAGDWSEWPVELRVRQVPRALHEDSQ